MAMKRFQKQLHVLVSDDESRMLSELAQLEGLTPSDVVRALIRRTHATAFGSSTGVLFSALMAAPQPGKRSARKRK